MLGVFGLGVLSVAAVIGVAYARVQVPDANKAVKDQNSILYYSDGHTVLAKIGDTNRQIVKLNPGVSMAAQNAVLAAEDMGFRSESGFSVRGIARAALNDISGGSQQGGSTITQQLVKNEYLTQQRTFTRKFKELFISIKIAHQQSHDQILQDYLNTIYFGRGANGIQAAAQAYFGVNASQLTVPQAAILAANIKQPGHYDPAITANITDTTQRYDYVLKNMVRMKVLSAADEAADEQKLPRTRKLALTPEYAGQQGFLINRSLNALKNMGISETELNTLGLHITTTWNKGLQKQAAQAVQAKEKALHLDSNIRIGLVCENPTNGEIEAAYGGKDYLKRAVDDAFYNGAQVGSSFKPYVLATALQNGIGLKSTFNPKSPQWFTTDGTSVPPGTSGAMHVTNDEGIIKGSVNLITATAKSLNTVYVPLGFKAGIQNVEKTAEAAGLQHADLAANHNDEVGGFFLGQASMPPLYQASGYSTFADDGTYIPPHTIRSISASNGTPYRKDTWTRKSVPAISPAVVSNVDEALHAVVAEPIGTAYPNAAAGLENRYIAGKTGTTNNSAAAWFVGYTPKQLVTAVGMWRYTDKKGKKPGFYGDLSNVPGFAGGVMGGSIPAEIWNSYMTAALTGKPVTQPPTVVPVGNPTPFYTAPPEVSHTPAPPKTCDPNSVMQGGTCRPKHHQCVPSPLNNYCNKHGHPGPSPTCGVQLGLPPCNPATPNDNQNNNGNGPMAYQSQPEAARPPEG